MKIIAIGDTHGRVLWKEIVQKEQDAEKIIFIGDYFDSRDNISTDEEIENFKEILEFKKNNMDRVVLLLGNHDFHYLKGAQEAYSGFQGLKFTDINEILEPAVLNQLVIGCYEHENYIFTHAGVTKTWCNDNNIDTTSLSASINEALLVNPSAFRFAYGDNHSRSGNDVTQPPIWVRIPSLMEDKLDEKTFVVGHTTLKQLAIIDYLIGIDTIGTSGEYLVIENNEPKATKL